jgi:hypothetical protein
VELLEPYRKQAKSMGRERFVARYPHLFLIKRPLEAEGKGAGDWDDKFSFQTRVLDDGDAELLDEEGPVAREWRVAEVRKREGSPFRERISIGRTKNCDVVLRFPSISKLHAHFLVGAADKTLRLADASSANGTALNGRVVTSGESLVVKPGDKIRFGAIDLELVDASAFYSILITTG